MSVDDPPCGHPGCGRAADYRITTPGTADDALRCRWHADAVWRPHGGEATVTPLYADVPAIDTAAAARRPVVPVLVAVLVVLVVLGGFAALAPVLL